MSTLEATVQAKIISILNAQGALCKNLHGNAFQSGMPDLFVISKKGVILLLELKMWRLKNDPRNVADLVNLTHKVQRSIIMRAWLMGCKHLYVVATNSATDKFWITNGTDVKRAVSPAEFIKWVIEYE